MWLPHAREKRTDAALGDSRQTTTGSGSSRIPNRS